MAKDKSKNKSQTDGVEKQSSVMGYFRVIFEARSDLLKTRSNDEVIKMWLADHPGHPEMPRTVRNTLANLKSLMRKKIRAESHAHKDGHMRIAGDGYLPGHLERLEMAIDDAMSLARAIDRVGLENVIRLLRKARNEVVWKIGQ